jgi:hypothetical protein
MLSRLRKYASNVVLLPMLLFATSPVSAKSINRMHGHQRAQMVDYPAPGGFRAWRLIDPNCPDSPDSFEWYVEYWNEDGSFNYDVAAGNTTYWCGDEYVGETFSSSWYYSNCEANSPWGCGELDYHDYVHP